MQIGGESIEHLLVNMVLGKRTFTKHKFEKTKLYASLLGNGLNKILIWNVQMMTTTYKT